MIEYYLIYFMCMFVINEEVRILLWWSKEEILEEFGLEGNWELVYEMEEWKYVEDEKVSENEFF